MFCVRCWRYCFLTYCSIPLFFVSVIYLKKLKKSEQSWHFSTKLMTAIEN
ncbi:hypothetical protein Hanom_Chr06g00527221 [Helianthus anomalus]